MSNYKCDECMESFDKKDMIKKYDSLNCKECYEKIKKMIIQQIFIII